MENEHKYRVVAWWTSGQAGIAKPDRPLTQFISPRHLSSAVSKAGGRPKTCLMTALRKLLTTTFHAIAGCSQFEYTDLAVETEGTVSKQTMAIVFSEIGHPSCLTIPKEEQRERAISLLDKAKALCLVSRALAIAQKFEVRIDIRKHSYQSEDRGIQSADILGRESLVSRMQGSLGEQIQPAAEKSAKADEVWFGRIVRSDSVAVIGATERPALWAERFYRI